MVEYLYNKQCESYERKDWFSKLLNNNNNEKWTDKNKRSSGKTQKGMKRKNFKL